MELAGSAVAHKPGAEVAAEERLRMRPQKMPAKGGVKGCKTLACRLHHGPSPAILHITFTAISKRIFNLE